ncbi:MAG: hypothetical protein WBP16_06695 [Ferruginibacter sp.]
MKKILSILLVFSIYQSVAAQNVGIGTTTPNNSAMLDITSSSKGLLVPRVTSAQRVAIATPANGLMVYDTDNSSFWYYNGITWTNMTGGGASSKWNLTGNNIYNNNSANVGVGLSTNINERFTLKGNGLITYTNAGDIINGGANATLKMMSAAAGNSIIRFLEPDSTTGSSIYYSQSNNLLTLENSQNISSTFRLYDNGNAGIGTPFFIDKAESKLQVDGGTFVNYGNNNGYLMLGKSTGTNIAFSNYEILARDNGNPSPLYLQHDGGAVRIGNTGATAGNTRLQITDGYAADLNNNGYAMMGTATAANIALSNTGIQARNNGAPGNLLLQTYGGTLNVFQASLVVAADRNVGIGTLTPSEKLQVNGNILLNWTNPVLKFQNGSVDKGFMQSLGDNVYVGTTSGNAAGKFIIGTNGSDKVFVDAAGNMSIGTQNNATGYILRVGGKIISEEVKVQLRASWPDYVFDDSYKLTPLTDVKSFIQKNKHLPGIPSATEVQKNGIELGDMQKRLMEKVEELTLYIIDQQQQIDELKKQINKN